jgi:hypothetical protein
MKRKTFDMLLSAGGLVVVAVLVVAGSLLTWGSSFISTNVHNQLVAQKIYFPSARRPAVASSQRTASRVVTNVWPGRTRASASIRIVPRWLWTQLMLKDDLDEYQTGFAQTSSIRPE